MDAQAVRKRRPLTRQERLRRKRRRRKLRMIRMAIAGMLVVLIGVFVFGMVKLAGFVYGRLKGKESMETVRTLEEKAKQEIEENSKWNRFYDASLAEPDMDVELLTVNEYSRPGEALPEVNKIFIHYTANPGTSAKQNRSYFESLAETHERSASAHFVVSFDGSIVQCIPTKEIAYAVMGRNYDSLSIECCYLEEDGRFTQETYESLIRLTAWLLHKYRLRSEDVLRHYDEGGKKCPKYYVEHEDAWQQFIGDLDRYMENVALTNGGRNRTGSSGDIV